MYFPPQRATTLELELDWLHSVIQAGLHSYFGVAPPQPVYQEEYTSDQYLLTEKLLPDLTKDLSAYAQCVKKFNMSREERIMLLLALTPHLAPDLLDDFLIKDERHGYSHTNFGGVKGKNHAGFLPTGQTALFLIAGRDVEKKLNCMHLFDASHFFYKQNILQLKIVESEEPALSGVLTISKEYLNLFTTGKPYRPAYSTNFPAQLITTQLDWEDLVLDYDTYDEIEEVKAWIKYGHTLLYERGLAKKIKKGYRSLFYGPPGTGKTLTASLLGKSEGLDVYRIDLSMVVSKYIGETEKNLASIFDQAENKNWILFFDEADALFGKRTQTNNSNDRYANQEVSYLLQRVEDFAGLVILATNLRANLDEAFSRRFQSIIYFPMPNPAMRLRLWQQAFGGSFELEASVNLKKIAADYEMAGGSIINVLRYCTLMALNRNSGVVTLEDILQGIRKEFKKEGKTIKS
jgi:hypothetical protein